MSFSTYAQYREALLKLIDGDDAGGSVSPDTLDMMISLGESRVYLGDEDVPGLRTRDMAYPLVSTIAANNAPIPDACLELARLEIDGQPLEYMSEDALLRLPKCGGQPRFYTQQGNYLAFYPEAAGLLTGRYYQRPEPLKTALNPAFHRYPECFLYAALAESAPFLGEDARLPMWKQLWAGWMATAERTERLQATSGSRLTIRTS